MTGFIDDLREFFGGEIARLRHRNFLEATMAAAASVAFADREISFAERVRLDEILDSIEAFDAYEPHEAIDVFERYIDMQEREPASARREIDEAIDVITDPTEADIVVRVAHAMAEADGEPAVVVYGAMARVCSRLGRGAIPPRREAASPLELA